MSLLQKSLYNNWQFKNGGTIIPVKKEKLTNDEIKKEYIPICHVKEENLIYGIKKEYPNIYVKEEQKITVFPGLVRN